MTVNLHSARSWHFLPIFLGFTSLVGMIATYFIAKKNCHIEKWFLPYISYTGTEHPESSLFGLILNAEGFLGTLIVILAWRFFRHLELKNEWLNKATLVTGLVGCFGVIIVANFQVSKNKIPHYIGAALALIVGTVYCTLSSILTYKIHKAVRDKFCLSKLVCALRFFAASLMVVSILTLSGLAVYRLKLNRFYKESRGEIVATPPPEFRYPNGSCVPIIDYVPVTKQYLDLAMSISEWFLTACLIISLSLYAYEFKYISNVKVVLKSQGEVLSFVSIYGNTKKCMCTSRTDSCNSPCDKRYLSADESENDASSGLLNISETSKFKNNNNTDTTCLTDLSSDSHNVSKSMPDISRQLCDPR